MPSDPEFALFSNEASHAPFSQRSLQARGQAIGELMSRALANPHLISLAAGFVDPETLPVEIMQRATERILSDQDVAKTALQYGSTHGNAELRALLRQWLEQADGQPLEITDDQVLLTAGSNQLLHLICDALLDQGDILLCASPTYLVFLGVMQNLDAKPWGVASDEEGMQPEALDQAFQDLEAQGQLERVKGVYLVSYFDNPAGRTAGAQRRRALAAVLEKWNARTPQTMMLLEDAAYRQLRFSGDDVPSFLSMDPRAEHTIYLGTFSKSFSPGVRVGWGILPSGLAQAVVDLKTNADFGSPHFAQQLMALVLREQWDTEHVQKLCNAYQAKRDVMLRALERNFGDWKLPNGEPAAHWETPAGGLYIWLELPPSIDTSADSPFWNACLREGVFYVPGDCCQGEFGLPCQHHGLRLSFGVPTDSQIEDGIAMLARAARSVVEGSHQEHR